MKKILTMVLAFSVVTPIYSDTYYGIVQDADYTKDKSLVKKSWSDWTVTSEDCTEWTPLPETMDLDSLFEQTRVCSYTEERSRDVFIVDKDGIEEFLETNTEQRDVTNITEERDATGTKNYLDDTRVDDWTAWGNTGSPYDCGIWNPDTSTVNFGVEFEQERDCLQDQTREQDVYEVWADGSEELLETNTENQSITVGEVRDATGSKNYITGTQNGSWSSWSDEDSSYNCTSWTPNTSTVDVGIEFEQERDCDQDQEREREIYDVWADGSETLNSTDKDARTISVTEDRDVFGTNNYITGTRNGSWSSWDDEDGVYNCTLWNPDVSTVDFGVEFEQERDCDQDQEREREIYNVWLDGSETLNSIDKDDRTINVTEVAEVEGTRNYLQNSRTTSWSDWEDDGSKYNCTSWTPSTSSVNLGDSFTQERECEQDQIREKYVYDVWADGSETLSEIKIDEQTIDVDYDRSATGTQDNSYPATGDCDSGWSFSAYEYECYQNDADFPENFPGGVCPSGYDTTVAGRCALYKSVPLECDGDDELVGNTCYP